MSTIEYSNWAVNLADVGAIYPFQGLEVLMVIIGVVFWLGWHIIQHKRETKELEQHVKQYNKQSAQRSIERY